MRWAGFLFCGVLAGCRFDLPAAVDASAGGEMTVPSDGMPDQSPADAQLCYGAGLGKVCLPSLPTQSRSLTGTIDTSNDGSCDAVITVTGSPACVIAGTSVDLPAAVTCRGVGSRPLVIVAAGDLTVEGTLDVGSERGAASGAGSLSTTCAGLGAPENDDGGGGGGAGGSFYGSGGDGGTGDTNSNGLPAGPADGGTPNAAIAVGQITQLRAGCRGGNGGSGGGGSSAGAGGRGGGVVYLIAGSKIQISGRVVAYGAGGSAGSMQGGAGGAGSGGMIGLDAPTVNMSGFVTANGGGGGEGGGLMGAGANGTNGTLNAARAAGGTGGDGDGGDGGNGSAGTGLAGISGDVSTGGGGGGGGGAGFIYVKGQLQATGIISPAAYQAP